MTIRHNSKQERREEKRREFPLNLCNEILDEQVFISVWRPNVPVIIGLLDKFDFALTFGWSA